MIHAERGFSHFCNSWILLCNGDMRQFVLNVFADMFCRVYCVLCSLPARDNIKIQLPVGSMSDCSWDCPPAFPIHQAWVIPPHLIPVNVGLARTQTLVNPQLSWLFGQFVINHNIFVLYFRKWHYLLLFWLREPKGKCLAACALVVCGYQSTFLLLI